VVTAALEVARDFAGAIAWASAPTTADSTQYLASTIPTHGVGRRALTTDAAGAITRSGRKAPELIEQRPDGYRESHCAVGLLAP
jgi:hypothetical protein